MHSGPCTERSLLDQSGKGNKQMQTRRINAECDPCSFAVSPEPSSSRSLPQRLPVSRDMWAKLSHALKPKQPQDDSDAKSPSEVPARLLEQHPNQSVFHRAPQSSGPPTSPPRTSRIAMFKRLTKGEDLPQRTPPLPKKPLGLSQYRSMSGPTQGHGAFLRPFLVA